MICIVFYFVVLCIVVLCCASSYLPEVGPPPVWVPPMGVREVEGFKRRVEIEDEDCLGSFCVVSYCIVLYCHFIGLCWIASYSVGLNCIVSRCVVLYCIVVYGFVWL